MARKKNNQKTKVPDAQLVKVIRDVVNAVSSGNSDGVKAKRKVKKQGASQGLLPGGQLPSIPAMTNNHKDQIVRMTGTDYYTEFKVNSSTPDGGILWDSVVSPAHLSRSRISKACQLYEKYRFDSLRVTISTKAPTTTSGGYLAGFCPDPRAVLPTSSSTMSKKFVRSLNGSVSRKFFESVSFNCRSCGRNDFLFVDDHMTDLRMSAMGKIFIITDGPPLSISGDILISVQLDWSISMCGPSLESFDDPEEPKARTWQCNRFPLIINDSYPQTIDSASSPDLQKFWEDASWNKVYMFEPPISANDSASSSDCMFFRICQGSTPKGLTLFSSITTAVSAGKGPLDSSKGDWKFNLEAGSAKPEWGGTIHELYTPL